MNSIKMLLTAVAQGAWAQSGWSVWDGTSEKQPKADGNDVFQINTAAEMTFFKNNYCSYYDNLSDEDDSRWCDKDFSLNINVDMTAGNWAETGHVVNYAGAKAEKCSYSGTFNGNGHTIRLKSSRATHNYQGFVSDKIVYFALQFSLFYIAK